MHILQINDAVAQDIAGGSRQYARQLARCMVESGHEVTFLVPRARKEHPSEEIMEGSRVLRFDASNPLQKFSALRKAFLQLHATQPVDAVIVHFGYIGLAYHLLTISQGIPTLRIFHGPWDREHSAEIGNYGWKTRIKLGVMFAIDRYSLRRSDAIVTLSNFMAKDVIGRFGIPEEKVSIIPGGVDTRKFVPGDKSDMRRQLGLPEDAFVVFTARRLVRRMGLDLLIQSVATARQIVPNLHVCIAGKGPLAGELQSLAEALKVTEQIHLLGYIDDQALIKYYQAADVFVLPSVAMEGFGLIILEALACDTPVLGTPVGAIPEVLGGFDPQLVLKNVSSDAIAEGLIDAYLTQGSTPINYRRMILERCDWSAITAHVLTKLTGTSQDARLQTAEQPFVSIRASHEGTGGSRTQLAAEKPAALAVVESKSNDRSVQGNALNPAVQETR